jgi:hypothetical protein
MLDLKGQYIYIILLYSNDQSTFCGIILGIIMI